MSIEEYFGDWLKVIDRQELMKTVNNLNKLYGSKSIMPAYKDIFKAFTLCSLNDLKVIMLGYDPYPQKDVATGILFGNKEGTENISPSLEVIKKAAIEYTMAYRPVLFDITLESWAKQGILMLNSALTVETNKTGSHTMLWRPFISKLIENIGKFNTGIVYVLFGSNAQTFEPYINKQFNHILKVHHPSYYARTETDFPLSVFFAVNELLMQKYGTPINWCEYL